MKIPTAGLGLNTLRKNNKKKHETVCTHIYAIKGKHFFPNATININ